MCCCEQQGGKNAGWGDTTVPQQDKTTWGEGWKWAEGEARVD